MTRDEIDAAIDASLKGLFPNAEHVPNTVGGLLNLAIWNAACDACAKECGPGDADICRDLKVEL